jgi:3-oxoacyl-[acyl-carrier protein] reductase
MKNILITGVSKGLGLNTTELLLNKGYKVFGITRTPLELEHANFTNLVYDLSDTENLESFLKDNIGYTTPLHGFVNNAATAYDDIITNLNLESLELMYKTNVFSPFVLTKFCIRNMIFNKIFGSIVHISSISVHTGYNGLSMYASTKGAIEAFSKNTAREWGRKKIRSNCVVAGFMETNMSSTLLEEQKKRIYQRTSLKEATKIESVSETIEFLLSDKSKSITGQNLNVDSGTI